ncbi:MAG TPA: hypothetical protein VD837_15360 [Terriglobales bacterium]|nr:hypothetical protein [Terriglobales bacterium]
MKLTRVVLALASFALTIPTLAAQAISPGQPPARRHATISQRREMQQQRIAQGIRSGSLTAAEAARLERREARLNRRIRGMKADGRFTARERARVTISRTGFLDRSIARSTIDSSVVASIGPLQHRKR